MKRTLTILSTALLLTACAGLNRGCSSWQAQSFGSDWIVVQYKQDGTAFNCWKLRNESVSNEHGSDGIYWKDTASGHLVHISGWYNRVQIVNGNYAEAARLIGVEDAKCGSGVYPSPSK